MDSIDNSSQLISFLSLLKRETLRYLKFPVQTIFTPVISIILMMYIFNLALSTYVKSIDNISYATYIFPGLVIMQAIMQSFNNSASSLVQAKMFGSIRDIIASPFHITSLLMAYLLSSVLRSVIVVAINFMITPLLFDITLNNIHILEGALIVLVSSGIFAFSGVILSIISNKFEHIGMYTVYIITPLSFLSGTFYSIDLAPSWFQLINKYNPVYYMIHGFRSSLVNLDMNYTFVNLYLCFIFVVLFIISYILLYTGYKTKN